MSAIKTSPASAGNAGKYIFGGIFDGTDRTSAWNWQRGVGESIETWIESTPQNLLGIAEFLKDAWDTISITPVREKTGWYVLRAAQAGDDTTDVHDVQGSNLSQSKQFNLNLRAKFVAAGVSVDAVDALISKIVAAVKTYQQGDPSGYATMVSTVTGLVTAGAQLTLALRFMDDLDRNGDTTLQSQYTYIHTVCISERVFQLNQGSFADIFLYTDEVFTEAEMRATEGIQNNFTLPQRVIDGAPASWLKMPTHSRLTSGMKREITISYLFADEWSDLYFKH